jgi:hypothetical protein
MVITENFDGNTNTFTSSPASAWKIDTNYYVSSPNSIRGVVPNMMGDVTTLTSPVYDFTNYSHVMLRFSHICKVSPQDMARVEYRTDVGGGAMSAWRVLPVESYLGKANTNQYAIYGFNANSYSEWKGNDNLALPLQSWWKEEIFDLWSEAGQSLVQFRFVITHRLTPGTQISYGWLIDNIEIMVAPYEILPPVVEFIAPLVKTISYGAGPWEINARVKSRTSARVENPLLKYAAIVNGMPVANDSILMTRVSGDSLWKAAIPQFTVGTDVHYSITGKDSLGNTITITSQYNIAKGYEEDVIIGTGTTTVPYSPYSSTYDRSWTRAIYYDWEFDPQGSGGWISSIAYNCATMSVSTVEHLSIYVKATTDNVITNNTYVDPAIDSATLVWGNATHVSTIGWNTFTFHTPFYLHPGQHLMVYWINDDGDWRNNGATSWYYTQQSVNNHIRAFDYNSLLTSLGNISVDGTRPNVKVNIINTDIKENSVSLFAININDSITTALGVQSPIAVTIKNKGDSVLTAATIYYSLNGGMPKAYNWTGNLIWDFNRTDTIDYYYPKINGQDTFVVWVETPNGIADSDTWDDTLTKIVYGCNNDIIMSFISSPVDTIFKTGPFEINANIYTLSGTSLGAIALNVFTIYNGEDTTFAIPMTFEVADNLWKALIPQTQFGSKVIYSVTLTDILGNVGIIADSFFIQRLTGGSNGWQYAGDTNSTTSNINVPFQGYYEYGWSQEIILASEINPFGTGGTITIAGYFMMSRILSYSLYNQSLFFKAIPVSFSDFSILPTYINPVADGATLVWSGTTPPASTSNAWYDITLSTPFELPPGYNLLVYWENRDRFGAGEVNWKSTVFNAPMAVYRNEWGGFPSGGTPTATSTRTNMRFWVSANGNAQDTSVALESINLPVSGNTPAGIPTPVHVTIGNKGIQNLTFCNIQWKLNGVLQSLVQYAGNLPENFTDTITLGYYTPVEGKVDTIVAWVSMPNGITDSITNDDTLTIFVSICPPGGMSGDYVIGSSASANFSSIQRALYLLKNCGANGTVRFLLEDGTYPEKVDLSFIANNITAQDTLILTSLSGQAQNVIIKSSEEGIILNNNQNIHIEALTVDVSNGNSSGIQFLSACTNIVIQDCRIFAPLATWNLYAIDANLRTGADRIFIINNLLDGGYYGINFFGGTTTSQYATNVVFDKNTLTHQYQVGAYFAFTDLTSCSYNTILIQPNETVNNWTGLYMGYCNGPVIGNRIILLGNATSPTGIDISYYNRYNTIDTAVLVANLVANNEIILSKASSTFFSPYNSSIGIHAVQGFHAKILHNSIYVADSVSSMGIYITPSSGDFCEIKNNNIVMNGASAFPVYLSSAPNLNQYNIDCNNMYAPENVGYVENNLTTIAAWQRLITTDKHSVRILPDFTDPTISLEPLQNGNITCNAIPDISQDINGMPRTEPTVLGCYEVSPSGWNAALEQFTAIKEGFVAGQTDNVKVVVRNTGANSLTSVNLSWSINGITQNTASYPLSLALWQDDTLTIGQINYTVGLQTVKVWINSINNGLSTDYYAGDDTLIRLLSVCGTPYNGTLTIGNGGDFSDIDVAYNAFSVCGVNGDVTLAFLPGTYNGVLDLSNNAAIFGNYNLTITSSTGNATEVRFVSSQVAVNCNNTQNITIKDITIDVTQGTYGIQLSGTISNMTVDNCIILSNLTVTSGNYIGIYGNSSSLDNLRITNCTIDGGIQGISLNGDYFNYGQNIQIDNNTITNQYSSAIYLYYINANSISYNYITPRLANAGTTWQALYGYYLRNGGSITGNHISANNPAISSTLSGFYLQYIDTTIIANNEIYLNGNASTINGIYMYNATNVSVINNSVYTVQNGTGYFNYNRAYSIPLGYGNSATIKNNLFVAQGGGATTTYAIYLEGWAYSYNNYGANYVIDYNNYYSSGNNIGFVDGGNRADLAAWKAAAPLYDTNSASILPDFTDLDINLKLENYLDTLSCPRYIDVAKDIDNIFRSEITYMGAYAGFSNERDLILTDIVSWNTEIIDKQNISVNVNVFNNGIVPINTGTFGWSLNGVNKGSIPWTAMPVLNSTEQQTVSIGSFTASNTIPDYNVVVWIETINGQADTVNWNDTLRASAVLVPLAEFVSPLVPDTTVSVLFPVNVFIRSWTGATLMPPKMTFISTVHGNQIIYDTVAMVKVGDIWRAIVPQQYYGSKVIYSLTLSDTIGNNFTIKDSTYIPSVLSILSNPSWTALSLADPLTITNVACFPYDYSAVKVDLENKTTADYSFSKDTLIIHYEIIDPLQTVYKDSIPYTAGIAAGTTATIELMPTLAIMYAGSYQIKVWLSSPSDNTPYYDTLRYTYISNRIALPIDEVFSSSIPADFNIQADNTPAMWQVISQGMGADSAVIPVFGNGVLSFAGSRGAMTTLSTRQMDLSQTTQPSLSFWYFHDTIPCEDYTDVRITIDGGTIYNTLFSLTKYDPVYGWKQYSTDLPSYAINQCVALVFEAMEKSNGDVTQYIDRILITAKQDIAISEIITSELAACDLQNKEVKIVLSNLTDPILDFATTPTTLTLEIKETGQTFTHVLDSGSLGRFTSDTISIATGVNFAKGTYTLKAYFSSVLDVDRMNDTFVRSIVINPALSVRIQPESGGNTNCLSGELVVHPTITLYNTGNMDLSNIDMILQVDTGENNTAVYVLLKETYTGTILAGDTATYMFINSSYSVPWNARYDVRTYAYLSCDSALVNSTNMVQECVDIKDLYIVSIDNPLGVSDAIGTTINATATLHNRADNDLFSSSNITVLVEDSKGLQTESFTENLPIIGTSATVGHTFTRAYTVPNDSVYYLTVFVNSQDNYRNNDTMTIKRETVSVGIETLKSIGGLTLYQNIPNPANSATRIDYSIPESGEVVFNLHSVSGQLLYSRTIEAAHGKQSLEVNTSSFAAGIYFYSIEYKGQRLVKRMMISN